jgi:hypothetical protein
MGPVELELLVGVLGAIGAIGAATSTSVLMGEDEVNTTIALRRTQSEVRMFEEKILKRDGAAMIAHREAIAAVSAERVRQEVAAPMKMSGTVVPVGANYAAASDKVVVPVGAMTKSEDQKDLDERITPVSRPADEARDTYTSGRAVIFPLFPTSRSDDHW